MFQLVNWNLLTMMKIIDQEWASLRDDSELCQTLFESDLMNMDEVMDEIDQSGNEQRSVTSVINNLLH